MRRARLAAASVFLIGLVLSGLVETRGIPPRLTNAEFWRIVEEFSEPGGYFPADNFISNEMRYQEVVPRLRETIAPGGVYLGVGPDQNFTYVVALRPSIAFIVDIRRQNLLQHLMFKSLVEMSPNRAEFASRLFGRIRPEGLTDDTGVDILMERFARAPPSQKLFEETSRRVLQRLERQHGFAITPDDKEKIQFLLSKFHEHGPDITYAPVPRTVLYGYSGVNTSMFPNYGELVTQTDEAGKNHGYLASEANYRFLREMQLRNLIVPVVGNFAGHRALRAVGDYVREKNGVVTTIYTSNVEQYLFQNQVWRDYYDNLSALPLDDTSTFIRAYFPFGGRIRFNPQALQHDPANSNDIVNLYQYPPSLTLLSPVNGLLAAVTAGRIGTYQDVIGFSR